MARTGAAAGLVLATLAGTQVASGAASAATPAWSIQPTPTQNVPTAEPAALSCPTTTWCMSVGSYTGSQGVQRPLAEVWRGTSWQAVPAVSAGGALGSALTSVSCTSPTACVAVGYSVHFGQEFELTYNQRAFAERWNGSSWLAITPPSFGIAAGKTTWLTSVSCSTATACTAVGSFAFQSGPQLPNGPGILLSWNGKSWSHSTVPAPKNASLALQSVSCAKLGACFVAGSYTVKGKPSLPFTVSRPRPSAAWHYRTPPAPFPTTAAANTANVDQELAATSVSCTSATACTMVGNWRHLPKSGPEPFPAYSEVWNGTQWHLLAVPNPTSSTQAELEPDSVSCWTAADCLATGTTDIKGSETVLTERRSGSRWTAVGGPASPAAQGDRSLFCWSATSCLTVGSGPRAGQLRGTAWAAVPIASPAGTIGDSLADVSCPSASTCTAVGSYVVGSFQSGTVEQPLIETGGAAKWSLSAAPSPAGAFLTELTSVACPTTTFCLTIGSTQAAQFSNFSDPVAEVWRGSSWQTVPTPDPGTNFGHRLADMSCVSASFCVAVGAATQNNGTSAADGVSQQLIEQWDGSSWHIVPAAAPAGLTNIILETVSCPSATSCTAIGASNATGQPFAESFDGTSWTPISHAGLVMNTGYQLSCTSASFCLAVTESDTDKPVAQSWNGSTWKTLATPAPAASIVNDVSCTSPSACTVIGNLVSQEAESDGLDPVYRPFAETWNGTAWSTTDLPLPGNPAGRFLPGTGTLLNSISCPAAGQCTAAGFTSTAAADNIPVIEKQGA